MPRRNSLVAYRLSLVICSGRRRLAARRTAFRRIDLRFMRRALLRAVPRGRLRVGGGFRSVAVAPKGLAGLCPVAVAIGISLFFVRIIASDGRNRLCRRRLR